MEAWCNPSIEVAAIHASQHVSVVWGWSPGKSSDAQVSCECRNPRMII